jgi:hypothetical protein
MAMKVAVTGAGLLALFSGWGCGTAARAGVADAVRMNQIQVIGSHNSYHVRSTGSLGNIIRSLSSEAAAWNYSHAPMDVQLERGVRSFELDVYHDPGGTRVMHVPLYDPESTCSRLVDCLATVRAWSDKNRHHVPIIILVELKDDAVPVAKVLPFDAGALEQLEQEIRSVFGPDRLLLPDDVRGGEPTLAEAIQHRGWPLLADARGKIMMVLHARGLHAEHYTKGHPSLEGRAMFLESQPGRPYASVFIRNDPHDPSIGSLVREGFIVRTRADADVTAVNENTVRRRDAALASGAHIVSTDFPAGEQDAKTGYIVALPGGVPARLNPINGRAGGASLYLETSPSGASPR